MFATVKHENGELKINPNCYIRIIYDYIREQLSIPADKDFDLYSEDGSACLILDHPPDTDGRTVLTSRQTYTLEARGVPDRRRPRRTAAHHYNNK